MWIKERGNWEACLWNVPLFSPIWWMFLWCWRSQGLWDPEGGAVLVFLLSCCCNRMSDRNLKEEGFQGISVIRPEARMVWLWDNSWSVEMVGGSQVKLQDRGGRNSLKMGSQPQIYAVYEFPDRRPSISTTGPLPQTCVFKSLTNVFFIRWRGCCGIR